MSVWHCQTSCPSTLGLHATSMLSVWRKVDGGSLYCCWAWPCSDPKQSVLVDHFIYSGLLVTRACHNILVVCGDVTAQDRRGFLGLKKIKKTNKKKKHFSLSFEVKWRRLADYRARLDCNDIKFWPDAPQKHFFVRSIIQVQFSLIGESRQTAVAVPFLSETTVHTFGLASDRVYWSAYLEYTGAIRSPPSIQQIVLPSAYEPFTCKETNIAIRPYLD